MAGSLAYLGAERAVFIGTDRQVFKNGGWTGFEFPYPAGRARNKVKEQTERLAEAVHISGARGYLNVDWAFTEGAAETPVALECNFRSNGFGYITEFAEKYFGKSWKEMYISCRESIPTAASCTAELIKNFSGYKVNGRPLLITAPGADEGAVITAPPFDGGFSAAVFSRDPEFTETGLKRLQEAA